MDQTQEVLAVIQEMDLPETDKQMLIAKLQSGGVTDELMAEIDTIWQKKTAEFAEEFKDEINAMDEAEAELSTEIETATKDFDNEIAALSAEAEIEIANASQELEAIDLEEARSVLE